MLSSSRRSFLQAGLVAPAALCLKNSLCSAQVPNITIPTVYATQASQSANNLFVDWQNQYIHPANVDAHYTAASILFGYLASSGINQQLAQLASDALRRDATLITRPGALIQQAAAHTGAPLDTRMLANLTVPASADEVINFIGGDFGRMQSQMLTHLAQVSSGIWSAQGVAWKSHQILQRNQIVQAKLRQYGTSVRWETVSIGGDFASFATLFVAGAAALIGGVAAFPVAAAAGGAVFAVWVVAMGMSAIGSAIGLAGMTYELEEEMSGGPLAGPSPYQGKRLLPNQPCLPHTTCME